MYRMKIDSKKRDEYEKQVCILREKVEANRKKLDNVDEKKRRIRDLFIEGMISKDELKLRQSKILSDVKIYNDNILKLEERIDGYLGLLSSDEDNVTPDILKGIYGGVLGESDLKQMNDIVKKHIKQVTSSSEWFGKDRDKRAIRQNAQLITVDTVYSGVKKFIYVARKYKGHKFFIYGTETPLFGVKKIEREPLGKVHPRAFKKIK